MGLTISDFFLLIQGFIAQIHMKKHEETHEDKNIARILIEEYI
jgi:hypothetical protein